MPFLPFAWWTDPVRISVKVDIDRARAFYKDQEKEVNRAAGAALQRTAVTVRTEASKDIRSGLNVKAGDLKRALRLRNPTVGGRKLLVRDIEADNNPQLMIYALGALNEYDLIGDFDTVTMVIHQPRLNHVSEYSIPVSELLTFGDDVRHAADKVRWEDPALVPGEKQCKFCKAKATCPALRAEISDVVYGAAASTIDEFAEFVPVAIDSETSDNYLPVALSKVELIEQWCKAVRAEAERRLLAGQPVTGYKLVAGRAGNRDWKDATAVEEMMKKTFRMRDDQVYDFKLISPTKAEKVFKENPKRWANLQEQIVRSEGKPSVAPATDKRPEMVVKPVLDDFRDLTAN
jgi:hypothetical protein